MASHNLKVLQENLESGRYTAPVLEHLWEFGGVNHRLMIDVDGVVTPEEPPLSVRSFNNLFEMRDRYEGISKNVEEYDKRINASKDGKWFEGIVKCWQRVDLNEDDFKEACRTAGEEAPVTPYARDAVKILHDEPPYIDLDLNSASFDECLVSFYQSKRLPVSLIKGSSMEFHKKRLTGRFFFNYGKNKLDSGKETFVQRRCHPNLVIKKGEVKFTTISDTKRPDIYLTEFVGLGGLAMWMDKSIPRGMQTYPQKPTVLEMNIPEGINDMRILTCPVKHLYRSEVIARLGSPEELSQASSEGKKLISLGQECLKTTDQEVFDSGIRDFILSSQNVLDLLSKFDFPRRTTKIDSANIDLLAERDLRKRKETLSKILETYSTNFPEINWK